MTLTVTHLNVDNYFSEVELFLFSFFDRSYSLRPQGLVLENNCLRIVYEKLGSQFTMRLIVKNTQAQKEVYVISFLAEAFKLQQPLVPKGFTVGNMEAFLRAETKPTPKQT